MSKKLSINIKSRFITKTANSFKFSLDTNIVIVNYNQAIYILISFLGIELSILKIK